MENYLKEINSVLGVVGSFVCLPDGSIAAREMPNAFDVASVEAAARVASQTIDALEASGQRIVETDLVFGQGRLLLKNLRGGILAIVCARNINIPLLNLTANGVAKRLASELKAAKPAASTPPTTVNEPAPSPVSAEQVSNRTIVDPAATIASPAELLNDRFFEELARELTRIMGPMSSIILEDEILELKEKREAFPRARAAELITRVSLAIHDESKRAKFLQVISRIDPK